MTRVELNDVDHIIWVDDDGTRYRREFEGEEPVDKVIGHE